MKKKLILTGILVSVIVVAFLQAHTLTSWHSVDCNTNIVAVLNSTSYRNNHYDSSKNGFQNVAGLEETFVYSAFFDRRYF